jgi:hypothetical protein
MGDDGSVAGADFARNVAGCRQDRSFVDQRRASQRAATRPSTVLAPYLPSVQGAPAATSFGIGWATLRV